MYCIPAQRAFLVVVFEPAAVVSLVPCSRHPLDLWFRHQLYPRQEVFPWSEVCQLVVALPAHVAAKEKQCIVVES